MSKKKKDARVIYLDLPGNRRARIAPETEEGRGGSSKTVSVARVDGQMPHDRMFRRQEIDRRQYAAAERMHSLYVRGGLVPVRAQAYEIIDNNTPEDAESTYRAREQYLRDLQHLDPRGASIVHRVCGEGITCREWAAERGVSRSYATERLREALSDLARKHGL